MSALCSTRVNNGLFCMFWYKRWISVLHHVMSSWTTVSAPAAFTQCPRGWTCSDAVPLMLHFYNLISVYHLICVANSPCLQNVRMHDSNFTYRSAHSPIKFVFYRSQPLHMILFWDFWFGVVNVFLEGEGAVKVYSEVTGYVECSSGVLNNLMLRSVGFQETNLLIFCKI